MRIRGPKEDAARGGKKKPRRGGKGEVFRCTVCGQCCKGFEITVEPWIENGLVHIAGQGSIGLEVWPWEARVMGSLAGFERTGLVLMPSTLVMEKERDRLVVLSYLVANEDCPFLGGKECIVYEERPNVCRYFPLVLGESGLRVSTRCPESFRPRISSDGRGNAEALRRAYPDAVDNLLRDIYIHESMVDLLGSMEVDGRIKWDWEPDLQDVLNRVNEGEWSDILDFTMELGFMTREEADAFVRDLMEAEDIGDRIGIGLLSI